MNSNAWHTLRGYVIAVATVLVTCLIWLTSTTLIGNRVSSSFFLIAVVIVSRFGGYGPSWLALILGAIPVTYSQYLRLGLDDPGFLTIITVYFILGTIINFAMQSERTARQNAERNSAEALDKQRLLEKEVTERKAVEQDLRRAESDLRIRETELRESQEELLLALNAARMGTWRLDLSTKAVALSDTAELMLGYGPGEFPGNFDAFMAVVHPDDREGITETIAARIQNQTGRQHVRPFRVVWPDGTVRWLESKGKPFFDEAGKPIRMIGVSMDITERKEAEDKLRSREAQLSGILDNATTVIYLKDSDGRYLLTNHRYQKLFQQGGNNIIGKTDMEFFPESIARTFLESDAKVWREQLPHDFEEVALHADGLHTYRSVKFPVRDESGKMIALGGISTDISDLKEAHEALKNKQDLLRNLIEVQENKKQSLCHEFHDGLIQYAAGSLMSLEGYRANRPSTDDLSQIDTAISNLRKGVEDGRRVIRGIRPAVLDDSGLEAAIDDLTDQFATSGITVTSQCDPQIGRLPDLLQTTVYRVVQEALNNARKHSGTDVVRIELKKTNGDLHLDVRDFGCGFDVRSARKRGFGLQGMTERVRLLGGECLIQSEQDAGTCISVRLPIPLADAET